MSSPVDIKENSEEKKETVSRNFIENIIDKDIEEGRCKKVVTRFHLNQMVIFTLDMQSLLF